MSDNIFRSQTGESLVALRSTILTEVGEQIRQTKWKRESPWSKVEPKTLGEAQLKGHQAGLEQALNLVQQKIDQEISKVFLADTYVWRY